MYFVVIEREKKLYIKKRVQRSLSTDICLEAKNGLTFAPYAISETGFEIWQ